LKQIGELGDGHSSLFHTGSPDEVFVLTSMSIVRWNLKKGEVLKLRDTGDFFVWMLSHTKSVAVLEGKIRLGCTGFICSLDPTVPGFNPVIVAPADWKTWR